MAPIIGVSAAMGVGAPCMPPGAIAGVPARWDPCGVRAGVKASAGVNGSSGVGAAAELSGFHADSRNGVLDPLSRKGVALGPGVIEPYGLGVLEPGAWKGVIDPGAGWYGSAAMGAPYPPGCPNGARYAGCGAMPSPPSPACVALMYCLLTVTVLHWASSSMRTELCVALTIFPTYPLYGPLMMLVEMPISESSRRAPRGPPRPPP